MKKLFVPVAALFTAGAGLIHLAFAGPHAAAALWLGAAFVGVGLGQLFLACLMVAQPRPKTLIVVCLVQTAIILAWGLSRTVGFPSGAGHWTRELPGVADTAATALEVLSVLLVLMTLPLRARRLIRRSTLAGALGLLIVSGSSAASRSLANESPMVPAHSHIEGTRH